MRRRGVGSECQYEDTETQVAVFDPTTYDNPNVPSAIFELKPPLHYNWHRTYDPMVGRYLEPDPLGQWSDFNPYRYAASDPVNLWDPDGARLPIEWQPGRGNLGPVGLEGVMDTPSFSPGEALLKGALLLGGHFLIDWLLSKATPEDEPDALHPKKQCEKGGKAVGREIKEAEDALRRNQVFRRWFHREYKSDQVSPEGGRNNPNLSPEEVRDAYLEWLESGKPGVK